MQLNRQKIQRMINGLGTSSSSGSGSGDGTDLTVWVNQNFVSKEYPDIVIGTFYDVIDAQETFDEEELESEE